MEFKYFSANGIMLPIDQAVIPLSNIEYAYGFGVYELIKIRNKITYFEAQHIDRLLGSAEVIRLEHNFTKKQISIFIKELTHELNIDSANLKIVLLGGKTKNDAQIFILPLNPLYPDRKFYSEGVKTITYQYERQFPQAKTLNMLGSYLAYKKAKGQNCYDALLTDAKENIIEGTRTNFFAIRDTTIYSQPKEKILEGVTRAIVLHIAKKHGFEVKQTSILKENLKTFDGAFLTSTSSKILPVKQIDDFVFQSIPQDLKLLMQKYDEFLKDSKGVFNPSK